MAVPVGILYTSNITPDPTYGIGRYTLKDFDRALRYGVADGHTLYPAMPYPSYALTSSDDVQALYAYFRYGVTPASIPNERNRIPFPFSMRWPLTLWRWAFAPSPAEDPAIERGAYLVEGLGHCGDCHTPRAAMLQVKAQGHRDGAAFLAGAKVEAWFAPSLRSGGPGSLEGWSEDDIATFLMNGVNSHGIAFGSMTEVIRHSTQNLTEQDARATARFLKSLTSERSAPYAYNEMTRAALASGDASRSGAQLYLDNCAACHRSDGKGYDGVFPALAGNPVIESGSPLSAIHIVLKGGASARTTRTPAQFAMPAFDWRLDDQDAAAVISFVRNAWGNRAKPVSADEVAAVRRDLSR